MIIVPYFDQLKVILRNNVNIKIMKSSLKMSDKMCENEQLTESTDSADSSE